MNACSTFLLSFADVSRNGMFKSSANSCAACVSTTFFETRSALFPTNSLFTCSFAYLSISDSHVLTLSKDS
uniref:GTP-binding protein YPTC1 n=1 Tax=Ulva partita TaxID=1605170 RepID=A0A1C9ZWC3_9CHLO|nr:GTP-binding protein YPTC1 [Ulva partita]